MNIPHSKKLPIGLLSSCFNNTSATYKYYWFLSILQELENGNTEIPKVHLFARMISNAWYTVNYFHVSFGSQDLIQQAIANIISIEGIAIDEKLANVFQKIVQPKNAATIYTLWHFDKNVPHWFLSPWFPRYSRSRIYTMSKTFQNDCIYGLYKENILINPIWVNYLLENSKLLKDFCYWNLSMFLQKKNPNVPDIPNKLIKPAKRNSLTKQRNHFWNLIIAEHGPQKCIYTGNELSIGNYALEHFIPYSFVSHDLIWNLIPADRSFNSAKGDKLPNMELYFEAFYNFQKLAIDTISHVSPSNNFLEEYLTVFPDLNSVSIEKFRERIQPLVTIASNNGFQFMDRSSLK